MPLPGGVSRWKRCRSGAWLLVPGTVSAVDTTIFVSDVTHNYNNIPKMGNGMKTYQLHLLQQHYDCIL